jgi:putative nucleotidyltransferase with HDIG domain
MAQDSWLNSIADNINVVLFRHRVFPTPGTEYLNSAISLLTGYPQSAFQENPRLLEEIVEPGDRPRFDKILSGSHNGSAVLRIVCHDGAIRPCEIHYTHILNREGQVVAVEGAIHSQPVEPTPAGAGQEISVNERIQYYAEKLKTASNIGMTLAEKLTLADVYTLLSASIMDLFPDLRMITIARFLPETKQLSCVSAIIENETIDASQFPPVALEPPGKGTQSEAVHTRQPVIINDLIQRQKQVSKVVMVDKDGKDTGTAPQSALCVPMLSKGEVLGVIQMQSPIRNRFSPEDAEMLSIVANTAAVAIHNATLVENLNNSRIVIQAAYDATLEGLSRALEMRDQETEGHTRRVAELTLNFGRLLRLDAQKLVDLWRGAYLHDIGKIGVPDAILRKAGPLNNEEWVVMRKHAELGARILADVPFLKNSLEVPHYHHEKWDGSGYPAGLKGEEIPLSARIFAMVDVWDALTSDRPYRKAWSREDARVYIRDGSGTHFDPHLVPEFLRLISA